MTTFKKALLLPILPLVLLAACAKERGVEKLKDPENLNLPKQAFTGKAWHSKVTVVKTSTNGGFAFIGYQSENRLGYFEFTRDKLKFIDAVSLYKPKGQALPALINEWPISHHDVKLAESEGNVTNREIEDDDKTWKAKRHFRADFTRAEIVENATFPGAFWKSVGECWAPKSKQLVDGSVGIENDHITFTVAVDYEGLCPSSRRVVQGDFTYTVHYKYSFWERKASKDYAPHVLKGESDPEAKRFGFFQTVVERMNDKTGLPENLILKNRWNPRRQFVDYYFAQDVPAGYKWFFSDPKHGVIARTNQVLAKNGIGLRFRIWDNDDGPGPETKGKAKQFGDGRYSFINFVDEIDPEAPLGYGPTDADPLTGEIIAGNTIIWTGYLKYYLKTIAEQSARAALQTENSTLFRHMKAQLKDDNIGRWTTNWDFSNGPGKAYLALLPEVTFGYPGYARFTARTAPASGEAAAKTSKQHNVARIADELARREWPLVSIERALRLSPQGVGMQERLEQMRRGFQTAMAEERLSGMNRRTFHTYPLRPVLAQAHDMALAGAGRAGGTPPAAGSGGGADMQKVFDSIVYRVSIHEFGHNLGLRHNFYGSVDAAHHGHFDENHEIVAPGTASVARKSATSSVMDYMDLQDEADVAYNWEPYDVAAIAHAYSEGRVDDKKNYLFCTDEHTVLNALCNRFDSGSTPTQIVLNMVKSYDDAYWTRNVRNDRQYWDSSGYVARVAGQMLQMKKFLPLWRNALNENTIRQHLEKSGGRDAEEINETVKAITADAKKAVRLALSFFDAVIQQKASDRPYADSYDAFSGELRRIGILPDKVFAMLMIMGNDPIPYDPNRSTVATSFMAHRNEPEVAALFDEIMENQLTMRVDMEPWFINFARALYGVTATDVENAGDVGNVDRMKVVRFTAEEMKDKLGIDVAQTGPLAMGRLPRAGAPGFHAGDVIGYAEVNDLYYVVSQARNPYAFAVVRSILEADRNGESLVQAKADLMELYHLSLKSRGDTR